MFKKKRLTEKQKPHVFSCDRLCFIFLMKTYYCCCICNTFSNRKLLKRMKPAELAESCCEDNCYWIHLLNIFIIISSSIMRRSAHITAKVKNNCVKAFLYFKNILDIDVPFEGHRLLIKYKYVM